MAVLGTMTPMNVLLDVVIWMCRTIYCKQRCQQHHIYHKHQCQQHCIPAVLPLLCFVFASIKKTIFCARNQPDAGHQKLLCDATPGYITKKLHGQSAKAASKELGKSTQCTCTREVSHHYNSKLYAPVLQVAAPVTVNICSISNGPVS
jgi:hypothetical protein